MHMLVRVCVHLRVRLRVHLRVRLRLHAHKHAHTTRTSTSPVRDLENLDGSFDLIVGSDLLYDSTYYADLLDTMAAIASRSGRFPDQVHSRSPEVRHNSVPDSNFRSYSGCPAVLGYPIRTDGEARFMEMATAPWPGFTAESAPLRGGLIDPDEMDAAVTTLTPSTSMSVRQNQRSGEFEFGSALRRLCTQSARTMRPGLWKWPRRHG